METKKLIKDIKHNQTKWVQSSLSLRRVITFISVGKPVEIMKLKIILEVKGE
jgi:hypothetical protein